MTSTVEKIHKSRISGDNRCTTAERTGNGDKRPVAWIIAPNIESGYLSHVISVFDRLGYQITHNMNATTFDVIWMHHYPFSKPWLLPYFDNLQSYQRVNHIPGSGYYTSKVYLLTSSLTMGIPNSFKIPEMVDEFKLFVQQNPNELYVMKNNQHRGIKILDHNSIDPTTINDSFIQQYIPNPYLIDSRKFDIGIYTVITSILPLRVYVYEGDILLRFCYEDYYPFDAKNLSKYVVGDDYTPIWEIDSLKKYYVEQRMTARDSLHAYISSNGGDASKIWDNIKETIADANMSPNLSSEHFKQNGLLYEQVLLNLFSLVGIANHLHGQTPANNFRDKIVRETEVSDADLRAFGNECATEGGVCFGNSTCGKELKCKLCGHCINYELRTMLRAAYLEHISKRNMRRILPAPVPKERHVNRKYTEQDRLLILWFNGKCQRDKSWCA